MVSSTKTPVHILSGFLGSGKTTLLNQLLRMPNFANTLVIINEFGDVALDHLLVEKSTDTIIELSNGCLCCSIRGELVDTLLNLADIDVERIIIETTGIADPLPVMQSITAHPTLAAQFKLAPTAVVFDLARGEEVIATNEDAKRQLALADAIILTKADLLEEAEKSAAIKQAEALIRSINSSAIVVKSQDCDSVAVHLLEPGKLLQLPANSAKPNHAQTYKSLTLRYPAVLSISAIERFTDHILHSYGDNILRIKGLVLTSERPGQPLVLQVSGKMMHPPEYLEKMAAWYG